MIVCLTVSSFLHLIALVIPLAIMTLPAHSFQAQADAFTVDLVAPLPQKTTQQEVQTPADQLPVPQIQQQSAKQEREEVKQHAASEESVRFEADRKVGGSYLDLLKAKIFMVWKYPDEAIDKGQQGKVSVSFVLDNQGKLVDIGIHKSSGSRSLDAATMAAIKDASPFGPLPRNISDKPLKITGQFCYVLD